MPFLWHNTDALIRFAYGDASKNKQGVAMTYLIKKSCIAVLTILASAVAMAEPVMLIQLESSENGIRIVSQQVLDIAYKASRNDQKAAQRGEIHRARAGGWVAQIIRADGSLEREWAIEDPRQLRGEFDNKEGTQNDRVDGSSPLGVFDIQVPVSSSDVTLKIVNRRLASPSPMKARARAAVQVDAAEQDINQGEFKLKGAQQ